ncbi:hypothetical protein VIGAN_10127600, partial [Vigna angularis var. angularis]
LFIYFSGMFYISPLLVPTHFIHFKSCPKCKTMLGLQNPMNMNKGFIVLLPLNSSFFILKVFNQSNETSWK